jgi:hypothetical protein
MNRNFERIPRCFLAGNAGKLKTDDIPYGEDSPTASAAGSFKKAGSHMKTGIQKHLKERIARAFHYVPRFRGNDNKEKFQTFYESISTSRTENE